MYVIDLFGDLPEGLSIVIVPVWRDELRPLPVFESVPAGFPSPAEDYLDACLDLNDLMVKHPAATFFVRVDGDSMMDVGIESGDVLVVDRAVEPLDGSVVVAVVNGDFTVKRVNKIEDRLFLVPENVAFDPIEITQEMDFCIWGVVTFVVHRMR